MIEEAQVVFHKTDEPDFIADLFDADVLAGEDGTEVDLSAADADGAALLAFSRYERGAVVPNEPTLD